MSISQFLELKEKVRNHEIDRPALIKALRKVRMSAINSSDAEVVKLFQDPVEVVADKILEEVRGVVSK